ncbi:MAG TPA: thioesterase family protein [Dehalococcoidia bacterium]|nr:thioesterase family protein [Dehalococcoidia bacterium]
MGNFDVDTRVKGESGRYRATLSEEWRVWGPAGGYVAAIAMRAAGMEAQIRRPASFSAHFLRIAEFRDVDLDVTVVHAGRRSESISVLIAQDGRPILQGMLRTAAEGEGLEHNVARMPDMPKPGGLKTWPEIIPPHIEDKGPRYPFWYNVEHRISDEQRALDGLEREHQGLPWPGRGPGWREWYRFIPQSTFDDPFVDAGRMLLLMDILAWPAASQPHPDSGIQAPNLDVTCWFHAPGFDSEFLLVDYDAPTAGSGLMNTAGRIWGEGGSLLATGGAQLLCVPVGAGVPPP